ncbi:MAG TPA: HAD hydrolase family protein [Candidatus Dormibacteraeota bacterium]|nr:HAD hydrolase family protein [Candidatus Dormibacteraeota bacterium]
MLDLKAARTELSYARAGIVRQRFYTKWLDARNRCTALLHTWWAESLDLQPVREPRMIFSLDVDGVLEDERAGFSCTGAAGAAALKLLELGRIAVLLNTARSLSEVRERVAHFKLLGGISGFGAAVWDGVFAQDSSLLSAQGAAQFAELRRILRADPEIVQDGHYEHSVRVSRIVNGEPNPIAGPAARSLLDRHGLSDLAFWVAPDHTDFVDRSVDKGRGLERLLDQLRLGSTPIAAMGDAACDVPMLRLASYTFVPAGTLPSYLPPRRQRMLRSRLLGEHALWEAACQLVPDSVLHRQVITAVSQISYPEWFPSTVSQGLRSSGGMLPRLKTALVARLTNKEAEH